MDVVQLVTEYGYLAVFVGCLLEGETVLAMAGFAAHQGHLSLAALDLGAAASSGGDW